MAPGLPCLYHMIFQQLRQTDKLVPSWYYNPEKVLTGAQERFPVVICPHPSNLVEYISSLITNDNNFLKVKIEMTQ